MTSVLVTGATGSRGGAVVDHLLASGTDFDVRGLTRNADGDRARALAETAAVLSEVTGTDVEAVHVPIEDAYESFGEEFTVMCEWFDEVGYDADIDALEETFGFGFTTLPEYLRERGWADRDGTASVPGWVEAME